MTAPAQGEGQTRPKLRRGQVVSYRHQDPVLGVEYDDLGVVLAVPAGDGESVVVRPLARVDVYVDPAKVQPISADDVQAAG